MPFTTDLPSEIEGIYGVPDQEYMLVKTNHTSITHTYQESQALDTDGNPVFLPPHYFPLMYEGTMYVIMPVLDNTVATVIIPAFGYDRDPVTMTRTAPNPTWAKAPEPWHP